MPLIGTLRQEADREMNADANVVDKDQPRTKSSLSRFCSVVASLMLPTLLMIQFNQADNAELGPWTVYVSVSLFTITSFLLRKALADAKITSVVVTLMPEWVALLASALFVYQYEIIGFLTMIFGMTLMSLVIVKESFRMLRATEQQVKKGEDEPSEVDIMVV